MRTVILGFTHVDRLNDYIPYSDGYRLGAAQEIVTLELREDAPELDGPQWAEAFFTASNLPWSVVGSELAVEDFARTALNAYAGQLRSLSKGDTVTYGGVCYACESTGWVALPVCERCRKATYEAHFNDNCGLCDDCADHNAGRSVL